MPELHGCKGIRYVSMFGNIGYFVAAKRLMLAMAEAGIPFTWTPMFVRQGSKREAIFSGHSTGDRELDPYCNRPLAYDTVIIHTPPDFFPEWGRRERGKRLIGHTTWETDSLPQSWPALFKGLDHVLVPSRWNREVFMRYGPGIPITVLPHVLGPTTPSPSHFWDDITPGIFVFYLIETWSARKNVDEVIRLYRRTFRESAATLLVVKTSTWTYRHNPMRHMEWARSLYGRVRRWFDVPEWLSFRRDAAGRVAAIEASTAGGGKVRLVAGDVCEDDIAGLHHRGDCYLSLSHGEGWGLGAFDAAAAGNPVIATGWGGALDYLDSQYAWVVGYDHVAVRDDDHSDRCDERHRWAQPRMEEAAAMMHQVAGNRAAARERARAWVPALQREFSSSAVAQRLRQVLADG